MTLTASGPIALSAVNVELGRASTAAISLGETAVRNLAGKATGAISLGNLYGKSAGTTITVTEGSYNDGNLKVPFVYAGYAGTGTTAPVLFGSISPTTYKGVFIKALYNVIGGTQVQFLGNQTTNPSFLTTLIVNGTNLGAPTITYDTTTNTSTYQFSGSPFDGVGTSTAVLQ